jgi:hypothetical protein
MAREAKAIAGSNRMVSGGLLRSRRLAIEQPGDIIFVPKQHRYSPKLLPIFLV